MWSDKPSFESMMEEVFQKGLVFAPDPREDPQGPYHERDARYKVVNTSREVGGWSDFETRPSST